jgi:hypothetical protein
MMSLGADLERAWHSPGVANATKKRIVRTLIDEIVVRVEDSALDLVIRWHGGDHSALKVRKNRSGQHRWSAALSNGVALLLDFHDLRYFAADTTRSWTSTGPEL